MVFSYPCGTETLPTRLWVDAEVRRLSGLGLGVYIVASGNADRGLVLQKISDLKGRCRLLTQQRDEHGRLLWKNALESDVVEERDADAYILRARERDPDLWIVEIEDKTMTHAIENISG